MARHVGKEFSLSITRGADGYVPVLALGNSKCAGESDSYSPHLPAERSIESGERVAGPDERLQPADADNFDHYPKDGGEATIAVERNSRYPSRIVLPMAER